nr:DUF596 domain-containing protein [Xylella taiwanensis]
MHILWEYVGRAHGVSDTQVDLDSFEERKNDFLLIIGKLLDEGRFKLGNRKDGLIMEGPTEALLEMFGSCFPASDEALLNGIWLVIDECPFVAVWVSKGVGDHGEDYYDWCF